MYMLEYVVYSCLPGHDAQSCFFDIAALFPAIADVLVSIPLEACRPVPQHELWPINANKTVGRFTKFAITK